VLLELLSCGGFLPALLVITPRESIRARLSFNFSLRLAEVPKASRVPSVPRPFDDQIKKLKCLCVCVCVCVCVSRQVLKLETLRGETELVRVEEKLPALNDLESGVKSESPFGQEPQSINWEIKRPVHREDLLLDSQAHLTLVKACTQQLLGRYNRLDDDLSKRLALSVGASRSSFMTQFRTNLWRSWLQQTRFASCNDASRLFECW
jgi:hypothetical protein